MECRFYLLDLGEDPSKASPAVQMWGIDNRDRRVAVVATQLAPYFYCLPAGDVDLDVLKEQLEQTLPVASVTVESKKRFGRKVRALRVACHGSQRISDLAKVTRGAIRIGEIFEDDLRLTVRYLTDYDLTPCRWHECEVTPLTSEGAGRYLVYKASAEPHTIEDGNPPKLRIMAMNVLKFGEKGSAKPLRDPIRAIAVAKSNGERELMAGEDEAVIIRQFIDLVTEYDPDVIVGFNNNRVDWPYLIGRCKKLGIKLTVGRDLNEPHPSLFGHISVAGRANFDLYDIASGIADLKVKRLENMVSYFQVDSAIEPIDELEVAPMWSREADRSKVVRHASSGAEAALALVPMTLTYAQELSALTRLPLDQVMTAAVGFRVDSYMVKRAHEFGELIPPRSEQPYFTYKGAIVLPPKPGLHEGVVVLDFASMYPSLMMKYNLSPDTLIRQGESVPDEQTYLIPEVNHRFRRSPDGFYRQVLSDLIAERSSIRKELAKLNPNSPTFRGLTERERAVKVIANACYGYAGWVGARWYVREVAESATALGRETITRTLEEAGRLGLKIVYGDTDSIFVEDDVDKVNPLLNWAKRTLDLEIRPERCYVRVLFTEAMKRYAGLMPDGSLDIVGLEVVRGDWSEIARQVQEAVLGCVLRDRSLEKAIEKVRIMIRNLRQGKVPVRDLAIRKSLTKPVSEYAVRAPHVEVAKKLVGEGWDLGPGDQVAYVIKKGSGPLYQRAEPYIRVASAKVDVEYYVQNQIKPVAMRILRGFGVDDSQLGP